MVDIGVDFGLIEPRQWPTWTMTLLDKATGRVEAICPSRELRIEGPMKTVQELMYLMDKPRG